MADKKSNSGRYRNWATIVYEESAPTNWLSTLAEAKIPALVSPLHNLDVNPTGEVKKSHWHVILAFEGVKTKAQAREVFDEIGGVGCEIVKSLRGYARYLCHLDNPEKARYQPADVRQYGGADYLEYISLTSDKYQGIAEIIDWCQDNDIVDYYRIVEYARAERFDWFRVLCDSGNVVREYIKSRTWSNGKYTRTDVRVDDSVDSLGE